MSIQVNVCSAYCPVELMSTGLLSMGCCPVGLLSWVSVHRVTVCWGCVLEEVSIGLVSGWATVRISMVFINE